MKEKNASTTELLKIAIYVWWQRLFCKHEYELEMVVSVGVNDGFGNSDLHFTCRKCGKKLIVNTVGKQISICHALDGQGKKRCHRI